MLNPQPDAAANVVGSQIFVKIGWEVSSGSEILVRRAHVRSAAGCKRKVHFIGVQALELEDRLFESALFPYSALFRSPRRFLHQAMQPTLPTNSIGCQTPNLTPLQTW